jgi:hypothetical protein
MTLHGRNKTLNLGGPTLFEIEAGALNSGANARASRCNVNHESFDCLEVRGIVAAKAPTPDPTPKESA